MDIADGECDRVDFLLIQVPIFLKVNSFTLIRLSGLTSNLGNPRRCNVP